MYEWLWSYQLGSQRLVPCFYVKRNIYHWYYILKQLFVETILQDAYKKFLTPSTMWLTRKGTCGVQFGMVYYNSSCELLWMWLVVAGMDRKFERNYPFVMSFQSHIIIVNEYVELQIFAWMSWCFNVYIGVKRHLRMIKGMLFPLKFLYSKN